MIPQQRAPVFILGGRYGDIIQLLPAFKAVHDRTGLKPTVVSCTTYCDIYEGVSYVTPWPMHFEWWHLPRQARSLVAETIGEGIVVQWWTESPDRIRLIQEANAGGLVLQCHGQEWGVDIAKWPNYGTSMWDRAGFTREEMMSLPVVFDQRDQKREELLVRLNRGRGPAQHKPLLLVNFIGHSSPFGPHPEVMRVVNEYASRFQIVDIGRIRATRLFDLLGLYDAAVGLITTDTATMHLAGAGNVDYIGFTVDGWTSSVPKGRCVLEIKYNDALHRLNDLRPVLEAWANAGTPRPVNAGPGGGGGVMAV